MIIYLLKNKYEKNRLDKQMDNYENDGLLVIGKFRDSVDLINCQLQLEKDPTEYNYLYVENLNRYYFINRTRIHRTGLYDLDCEFDPIETYKNEIKKLKVIVNHSVNNTYNNNFNGAIDVRKKSTKINFNGKFNEKGNIILITV
jgi:hypothetical protein